MLEDMAGTPICMYFAQAAYLTIQVRKLHSFRLLLTFDA